MSFHQEVESVCSIPRIRAGACSGRGICAEAMAFPRWGSARPRGLSEPIPPRGGRGGAGRPQSGGRGGRLEPARLSRPTPRRVGKPGPIGPAAAGCGGSSEPRWARRRCTAEPRETPDAQHAQQREPRERSLLEVVTFRTRRTFVLVRLAGYAAPASPRPRRVSGAPLLPSRLSLLRPSKKPRRTG